MIPYPLAPDLNPLDLKGLLELGFAGIVLIVLFFVLLKGVIYAHDLYDESRQRTNYVNKVHAHIAVYYGDFLRSYQRYDVLAKNLHEKLHPKKTGTEGREKEGDTGRDTASEELSLAEHLQALKIAKKLKTFFAGDAEPPEPEARDILYTEDLLDSADVAANLDKFSTDEGALALWFVQLQDFFEHMIETWNKANDANLTDKDCFVFYHSARQVCAEATLVGRAFLDPSIRATLKAGLLDGGDNAALMERVFKAILEEDNQTALAEFEIPIGSLPMRVGALWSIRLNAKPHWEKLWFGAILVVAVVFVAGTLFAFRDQLDRPVGCKAVWKPGAESAEVSCNYTARSLEAAIRRVADRGEDGAAPEGPALFDSLSDEGLSCTATLEPDETAATMVCTFVADTPTDAKARLELFARPNADKAGEADAAAEDEPPDAVDPDGEEDP